MTHPRVLSSLGLAAVAAVLLFLLVYLILLGWEGIAALDRAIALITSQELGAYALLTLAIGFLAMALIQVARYLWPIRGRFHERMVRSWLRKGIEVDSQRRPTIKKDEVQSALESLERLAITRRRRELFDLPLEQLCGQFSAAAERVLEAPTNNGRDILLAGLAGEEGAEEAREYRKRWSQYLNQSRSLDEKELTREDAEFLRLRDALSHHIQRNIDGLQITAGQIWRRSLRAAAVLLSILLAFALTWQPGPDSISLTEGGFSSGGGFSTRDGGFGSTQSFAVPEPEPRSAVPWTGRLFAVLLTGVLGGFAATVARDLVAILERLRR